MNKILIAILAASLVSISPAAILMAADGWEANITVTSGSAKSRLSFGQQPDATDQKDNRYDVRAMLSGTLHAWFDNDEADLWRDIRATGEANEWQLKITSGTDSPISISWDPSTLPDEITAELIDSTGAGAIDMKSATSFTLNESSEAELMIIINNK